jgi:hypothetical protein
MLYRVVRRAEDTKGVIRIHKSKKDKQHNGQKKKYKMFIQWSCSAMAVIAVITYEGGGSFTLIVGNEKWRPYCDCQI